MDEIWYALFRANVSTLYIDGIYSSNTTLNGSRTRTMAMALKIGIWRDIGSRKKTKTLLLRSKELQISIYETKLVKGKQRVAVGDQSDRSRIWTAT